MHCGCSGVRCLCSFFDHHVLPDTDALQNPQRQLTGDRRTV